MEYLVNGNGAPYAQTVRNAVASLRMKPAANGVRVYADMSERAWDVVEAYLAGRSQYVPVQFNGADLNGIQVHTARGELVMVSSGKVDSDDEFELFNDSEASLGRGRF